MLWLLEPFQHHQAVIGFWWLEEINFREARRGGRGYLLLSTKSPRPVINNNVTACIPIRFSLNNSCRPVLSRQTLHLLKQSKAHWIIQKATIYLTTILFYLLTACKVMKKNKLLRRNCKYSSSSSQTHSLAYTWREHPLRWSFGVNCFEFTLSWAPLNNPLRERTWRENGERKGVLWQELRLLQPLIFKRSLYTAHLPSTTHLHVWKDSSPL